MPVSTRTSPICVRFCLSLVRKGHGIPLIFHGKVMEFNFTKVAWTLNWFKLKSLFFIVNHFMQQQNVQ